jgi:formimidoylglutamate deiminase
VLAESGGSTGRRLYELGLQGGAAALGQPLVGLTVGAPADIVSLDAEHPALVARQRDSLIDSLIFSAGRSAIDCVWTMGRKQVSEGRHVRRDEVFRRFHAALSRLIA